MKTITLRDAMRNASLGKKFDCVVVSADLNRDTGGEFLKLQECELLPVKKKGLIRDPDHDNNDTRNLIQSDGSAKSFHPRLMTEFDGKEVIY